MAAFGVSLRHEAGRCSVTNSDSPLLAVIATEIKSVLVRVRAASTCVMCRVGVRSASEGAEAARAAAQQMLAPVAEGCCEAACDAGLAALKRRAEQPSAPVVVRVLSAPGANASVDAGAGRRGVKRTRRILSAPARARVDCAATRVTSLDARREASLQARPPPP